MMIRIIFILALLFAIGCAQFSSNIEGYNLYVYKLPYAPAQIDYVMGADSVGMTLQWERGIDNLDTLIVPVDWEDYYQGWIPNTETLWSGETAESPHTIVLIEGYYAFALDEVDINNFKSGKSYPFYLQSMFKYAKVPINLLMIKR